MGRFGVSVLCLVVIGNVLIFTINADNAGTNDHSLANNGKEELGQQSGNLVNNLEGPQKMQLLAQLAFQDRAMDSSRADDHANVDLEKLQLYRYDTMPINNDNEADGYINPSRLVNLRTSSPLAFYRSQLDQKRSLRDASDIGEGKDYYYADSLYPPFKYNSVYPQSRAARWTGPRLRDMIVPNGFRSFAANDGQANNDMNQLSRRLANVIRANPSYLADRASIRDKRRRICKADGNGVKNPSFCDGDVYFKASDYDLNDVWDKVGRR